MGDVWGKMKGEQVNHEYIIFLGKIMNQNFVPVLDDQKNFIGIITRKDVISYLCKK